MADKSTNNSNKSFSQATSLAFLKRRLKPKTYWDELAELDLLLDYIDTYMVDKFDSDPEFKEEIFKIVLDSSSKIEPKLEAYLLERLIHSLSYFNETIKEWIILEQ